VTNDNSRDAAPVTFGSISAALSATCSSAFAIAGDDATFDDICTLDNINDDDDDDDDCREEDEGGGAAGGGPGSHI
jgi:hypothetical protein